MLWGNLVGLAVCFIQSRFRIFTLDSSTYYLDAVPIDLNLQSILLLNAGALIASMLMMLGPAKIVTTIHPAKTIRFE
jgi:lipoprotein-releasing system permease protein